jgi:hypothetical protein
MSKLPKRRKSKEHPNNISGQASSFLSMTAIQPDEVEALREYLHGFRDRKDRPFDRVPGTHMARFVIVENFNCKPAYKQRHPETIACASLCFSSNLDGSIEDYLDVLCDALQPEAQEIWGRCCGSPAKCEGTALKEYLRRNQINSGFFYAAYPNATVDDVKRVLAQRDQLMAFATNNQGAPAEQLQQAFLKELA